MNKKLSSLSYLCVFFCELVFADDYSFDSSLVWGGHNTGEIITSVGVSEGVHSAKFIINHKKEVLLDSVSFLFNKKTSQVEAFLSAAQLQNMGISYKNNQSCFLSDLDDEVKINMANSDGVIEVLVPQWLLSGHYNDISPEKWGNGSDSISANYNLGYFANKYEKKWGDSFFYNSQIKGTTKYGFIAKSDLNFIKSQNGNIEAKNNYFTVQKDIKSARARMVLGRQYSNGYFFEPYKLTGLIFANSKDMWPESEYLFKPHISGVVNQPSIIEIYQNNLLIRKEEVQSGKYDIKDYNPLYYGGDFEVKVKDVSGNNIINQYTIPYSTGGLFVNKHNYLYKFVTGRLTENNSSYKGGGDNVYELGVMYGLSDIINLRYGYLYTDRYHSILNGVAINTIAGLASLDVQMSASRPEYDEKSYSGFNLKTTYQKNLNWGYLSNIVLANNIYNSQYYRSLNQTYAKNNESLIKRDSSLQLNGQFGGGSLNFGGGVRQYWGSHHNEKYLSAGYNGHYGTMNYNINILKSDFDTSTLFNIQIPFGQDYNSNVNLSYITNTNGLRTKSAFYNKSFYENNTNIGVGFNEYNNRNKNISASAGYSNSYLAINQTVNKNNDGAFSGATNLSGSLVYIDDSFIFLRRLSDTAAIIKAEGMENGKVNNSNSIIGRGGYGQISVNPYRRNVVTINSENTSLKNSVIDVGKEIIPIKDSLSLVKIETESTNSIFIKFNEKDILDVNFSAPIYNLNNEAIGYFGQGNYVLLKKYENGVSFLNNGIRCNSQLVKTKENLLGLAVYQVIPCK
ncbi:fimbria/pilus outer membrane usher protein [Yokenella regensburgei]|uniref:fimbria/pilus outer membrane usher protein n=1 Tax=Yokenella regensburgei TaxID=158877 RepID=UPI001375D258|nr:fimbria/pilus outer membrane usher protein [Yokenella regensburgei]KAF1366712.1 outer membrane usher protein [Yokenella regensburgei]